MDICVKIEHAMEASYLLFVNPTDEIFASLISFPSDIAYWKYSDEIQSLGGLSQGKFDSALVPMDQRHLILVFCWCPTRLFRPLSLYFRSLIMNFFSPFFFQIPLHLIWRRLWLTRFLCFEHKKREEHSCNNHPMSNDVITNIE